MSFAAVRLALLLAVGPAAVAGADEIHLGRCHMDYCSWFSIDNKDAVRSGADGTLYKIAIRGWSSHHPDTSYDTPAPREGGETSVNYIYCSTRRPAVVFQLDGQWIAHVLAPGTPDSVFGYNETSYKTYFLVCHGQTMREPFTDVPVLARRFGYPATLPQADQIDLKRPEDILN